MVQSDLSKAFGINENRPSLPSKVTQTRHRKPPTAGIEVDERPQSMSEMIFLQEANTPQHEINDFCT